MKASGSPSAESSPAEQALSRALERERAEQPEVRYDEDPDVGRAPSRGSRITMATVRTVLLVGALLFIPGIGVLAEKNSAAREAIVSALAALIGWTFAKLVEAERRPQTRDRGLRRTTRKYNPVTIALKRLIDIGYSSLFLVVTAPLLLFIAVALKLEDQSAPVIFGQHRIGRDGVLFRLLKFRTIRIADDGSPSLGRVGRWLRTTALDELPQLINVLMGDMSLVGPRAIRPMEPIQTAWWISHSFAPGLIGPAQISDANLSIQEREKLDMWYEETWSPALDFKIVVKTVAKVFKP
jgi:lipopolysaccharide/colanic/teichoic acid biosynthesis glycosyltransferase